MHGDELRLRYLGELHKPWSGVGHVIKIADSILVLGNILVPKLNPSVPLLLLALRLM